MVARVQVDGPESQENIPRNKTFYEMQATGDEKGAQTETRSTQTLYHGRAGHSYKCECGFAVGQFADACV